MTTTDPTSPPDGVPFDAIQRGEELLARAKSVSQRITDRVRQVSADDGRSDADPGGPEARSGG